MEDAIANKVMEIVRNQLMGSDIDKDSKFLDLGFDSLDLVNIGMSAEEEFGITIDENQITMDTTIGELIDYIKDLLGNPTHEEESKEVN